jgi:hypothetical protein
MKEYIYAKVERGHKCPITIKSIFLVLVDENYISVYTTDKQKFCYKETLTHFCEQVKEDVKLIRIHRCHALRFDSIEDIFESQQYVTLKQEYLDILRLFFTKEEMKQFRHLPFSKEYEEALMAFE